MNDDVVVDHDHTSGDVRAVVCRWCNSTLGKIENWAFRIGQGIDPLAFVRNVAAYLTHHAAFPSNLKYPTYKTDDEKRIARNTKARKTRAAERKAQLQESA